MTFMIPNRKTGVYCIENAVNGKVYIGSAARCIRKRWRAHRRSLDLGEHHSRHLQRAWDRYGKECFVFSVLIECPPDECLHWEQEAMDMTRSFDRRHGYNISPKAGGNLGVKHTKETKAKVGAASKRWWSNNQRICSAETRELMRQIALARPPMSAETRAKLADLCRGRKHTAATKAKMRASGLGHPVTLESRNKNSITKRRRSEARRLAEGFPALDLSVIIRRYQAGETLDALAKEHGFARAGPLRKRLIKEGVPLRSRAERAATWWRMLKR